MRWDSSAELVVMESAAQRPGVSMVALLPSGRIWEVIPSIPTPELWRLYWPLHQPPAHGAAMRATGEAATLPGCTYNAMPFKHDKYRLAVLHGLATLYIWSR